MVVLEEAYWIPLPHSRPVAGHSARCLTPWPEFPLQHAWSALRGLWGRLHLVRSRALRD